MEKTHPKFRKEIGGGVVFEHGDVQRVQGAAGRVEKQAAGR